MIKRTAALVLMTFTALPAWADDIVFSPDATISCLEIATTTAQREICIGTSANLCTQDTDGGMTTMGISRCLWAEQKYWDARLNESYQEALASAVVTDAEMTELGVQAPSLTETLKAMQRAWISFRDASCDYTVAQWSNGTGSRPAGAACQMRMTGEQTLLLEAEM